ncbi:MAG TPA: DUF4252 domain-containing protein [Rubricoccaceae bacterium]|jgi:hypothetical protein
MTRFLALLALLALASPASLAQPARFDLARLDAFFDRPPKVEVNLRGAMLRLAASATEDDEDGTAEMLRGLRSILVRVYALDTARDGLVEQLATVEREMETSGWSTLVRVRPDGEDEEDDVWVYVREAGDAFDGLAVVSLDHESGDASFVMIDGPIDPEHIGSLGGRFGIPDVDAPEDAREFTDEELEHIEAEAERAVEQAEAEAERAGEQAEAEIERAEAEFQRSEAEFRRSEAEFQRSEAEFRRAEAARAAAARAAAKPARP